MKTLAIDELRKLEVKKLGEELQNVQKELMKINFSVASGQSKSSHLIRTYKKYIATIKTLLRELQLTKNNEN